MGSEPFENHVSKECKNRHNAPEIQCEPWFFPESDVVNKGVTVALSNIINGVKFKNYMQIFLRYIPV